ncbi:hypothetical protein L1049_003539 [Liquidambar formosana]|uniref:RNase H type-1 domain-containing protein n=1 Tax=Liquidambar formosana TaxID=63359 RepID=A0AAP0N5I4_LIQFO
MTGRFKVNVDGALFVGISCVGFGVVVQDHEGQVVAAALKRHRGLFNATLVEAMAIRFAVDLARDLSLRVVDLGGDILEVMAARSSYTVLIIEDSLVEAAASFVSCHFSHIGKKGNEVAHGLAKYAKFVGDVFFFRMEEIPSCVSD